MQKLGQTPVHCIIKKRNIEIIELLLKHGCNIKEKTNNGESPLHLADISKYSQTVEYLLK